MVIDAVHMRLHQSVQGFRVVRAGRKRQKPNLPGVSRIFSASCLAARTKSHRLSSPSNQFLGVLLQQPEHLLALQFRRMDVVGVFTQEHGVVERRIEADRSPAPGGKLRRCKISRRADEEMGQAGLLGLNG